MPGNICAIGGRGPTMTDTVQIGGIAIAGSVGMGGQNRSADVVLVQQLLNIARLVSPSGGQPALKTDGIAGPLTIAAISRVQKAVLGFSDGRVDPGGRTLSRLNVMAPPAMLAQVASSPDKALVGAPPAAARMTPLQAAMEAVPRAKMWTSRAQAHLAGLRQGLILSSGIVFLSEVFSVANTHFHLDRDSNNLLANLGKISNVFNRISQMLNDPNRFFREGASTADSKFADAPTGGFTSSKGSDVVTFRTEYPDCGQMCRSAMIIHEGAHYCRGPREIIHFAHEFPKFDGKPQDGGANNYANMPTSEAMRNAASYAAFAIQAALLAGSALRSRRQEHLSGAGAVTAVAEDLVERTSFRNAVTTSNAAGRRRRRDPRCAYGSSVRVWGLTSGGRGPSSGGARAEGAHVSYRAASLLAANRSGASPDEGKCPVRPSSLTPNGARRRTP